MSYACPMCPTPDRCERLGGCEGDLANEANRSRACNAWVDDEERCTRVYGHRGECDPNGDLR